MAGAGSGGEVVQKAPARQEREGEGAGLGKRLLSCLQGCAQAAHLPASLIDPPTLHPFNKASLINETMKKLLQGTRSLVYSLGLCHLICEMAGCEDVSSSAQTLSLSGQSVVGGLHLRTWTLGSPGGQFLPCAEGQGPLISLPHVRMEENPVNHMFRAPGRS